MLEKVFANDLKEIQEMIEQEFPYVKKPKEKLESKIDNPFFFLFKKTVEGKLAGFIEIEVLEENKFLRLNGITIHPVFRKKGIGKQLLKKTIDFLREKKFETIFLLVKKENAIAIKLYESQGFAWVRTLPEKIDNAIVEEYKLEFDTAVHGVH